MADVVVYGNLVLVLFESGFDFWEVNLLFRFRNMVRIFS